MSEDLVTGYLRRLDLIDVGPPSAEALSEIMRAHMERVAYNTVDIQLGRPTPIAGADAAARIVEIGRGGYCFHLNGALGFLLDRLGYDVTRHRGGVWGSPADTPLHPDTNHLVLVAHGLPNADNPSGDWFVDVGLGDAPHWPMPLRAGEYQQGPVRYTLSASPSLAGGWRFQHDPSGGFTGMDFEGAIAAPDAFEAAHERLSTSPTSSFVRNLSAARRDASGADRLVACLLRRIEGPRVVAREVTERAEWFAVLADVFGLTLADVDAEDRDALWKRVRSAHDEWVARGRTG